MSKYYPMQGSNRFETASFPVVKAFTVDLGAMTSGSTNLTEFFPKGSIVLGFSAKVTEGYVSAGAGTFTIGFTGTDLVSGAVSSGVATEGAIIGPSSASSLALTLTADDSFDIVADTSAAASAGKLDVYVAYIPISTNSLSTSDFKSFTL